MIPPDMDRVRPSMRPFVTSLFDQKIHSPEMDRVEFGVWVLALEIELCMRFSEGRYFFSRSPGASWRITEFLLLKSRLIMRMNIET